MKPQPHQWVPSRRPDVGKRGCDDVIRSDRSWLMTNETIDRSLALCLVETLQMGCAWWNEEGGYETHEGNLSLCLVSICSVATEPEVSEYRARLPGPTAKLHWRQCQTEPVRPPM